MVALPSFYTCVSLLALGPTQLGVPPPRNNPPTISALSHKMLSTSYPSVVDLVKLDLVHMKKSLFTHEGVKSSFYVDPLSHYEGFYSGFYYAWASLPIYSSPKCNQQNLIFQFSACKFWNITGLRYLTIWRPEFLKKIWVPSINPYASDVKRSIFSYGHCCFGIYPSKPST